MANKDMQIVVEKNDFLKIAQRDHFQIATLVKQTALDVETRMKVSMSTGTKSGRAYKRGEKVHVASAPGEAPAVDTGHLISTIVAKALSLFTWLIEIGASYARPLEFGSGPGSARPFVRPAVKGATPRFIRQLKRIIG